jgi:hypothetical protein
MCDEPVSWLLDDESGPNDPTAMYVMVVPEKGDLTTVFDPYYDRKEVTRVYAHFHAEGVHKVDIGKEAPKDGGVRTTKDATVEPLPEDTEINFSPITISDRELDTNSNGEDNDVQ